MGASSWAKVIAHCVHDHYYLDYNSEEDSLCHARVFDKRVSEQNLCKTFEKHPSHCCPFVSKYMYRVDWEPKSLYPQMQWTSQLDSGSMTGGLERVVSVHNSTQLWCPVNL